MKCLNCGKEFEAKTKRAKYCSHVCRAKFAQRDAIAQQNIAQREAKIIAQRPTGKITDNCGTEHEIDYEMRRDMQKRLVADRKVGGNLGNLNGWYQIIRLAGHINRLEKALQKYLGLDMSLKEMRRQGYWVDVA